MLPTSPWPALVCLALAMATAALLTRRFGAPDTGGRFVAIDGLRGPLAFFVFLHHSCVWYYYARTGRWEVPDSSLYTHFGQSSVALFFMITGFLFFTKLIAGRHRPIDWGRLYVSRVLRLVPLYFFVLLFFFSVVAVLSAGTLREPIGQVLKQGGKWILFTIFGAPNINGVAQTSAVIAGVTWSLAYEWLFYLSLPALALLVRASTPPLYLGLGIASVFFSALWKPELHHLLPFAGGMAAAVASRFEGLRRFCTHRLSTLIPLAGLFLLVWFFPSSYGAGPLLLLALVFGFVACGNSLFGLLTHPASLTLGAMAYSLYLVHGLTLFLLFHFGLGLARTRALTPTEHWLVIAALTPVLIVICFFTYRQIERPAMLRSDAVLAWLRARRPIATREA